MSFSRLLLTALAATAVAGTALAQTAAEPEGRVIVRFKPQADSVRAKALSARASRLEAREVAQTRATALGLRTGRALRAGLSLDERTHVVSARGLSGTQLARALAADPEVELVAVDERRKHMQLPNDPLFGGATPEPATFIGRFADSQGRLQDTYSRTIDQWYLKAPSGAVVSGVNAPALWNVTLGTPNIVVAVLDTGIRPDHPDLVNQLLPPALPGQTFAGYDMVGLSSAGTTQQAKSIAMANDSDGADPDASDPGDWITSAEHNTAGGHFYQCDPASDGSYPQINSSWHGTRVAGLIAARHDGVGMAGVGPGLKLLPIRVLGKCGGYDSDIMAGMKWAAGVNVPGLPSNTNRAKVLNLSLGGSGSCDPNGAGLTAQQQGTARLYREAIAQVTALGTSIVVAAGNSAGQAVGLPGNCPGVITVAALRHVGTKVGFSSVGPEVTIAAPGGNCVNTAVGYPCLYPMVSTTNRGTTAPVLGDASHTNSSSSVGTSFSAPIVSGIVGLMASVRPGLTAAEATQILKATARPFPTTGGGSAADGNPPMCTAPTTADQLECYCTTATCGAGMVDAAAAVAAAQALNGASIAIAQSPAAGLTAGQTLTLTATASGLPAGRSIVSTAWTITNGGGIVSAFASGAASSSSTIVPSGAGSFTVRADMTDNLGLVYSQSATVTVAAAAPTPTPTPTPTSSGGGGGGSVSAAWLLALLAASLSLTRRPRRPALRRCCRA